MNDFHKISLNQPTTTLVFTGRHRKNFYYLVDGLWVEKEEYFKNKRSGVYDN